jgi:hypothetical protein
MLMKVRKCVDNDTNQEMGLFVNDVRELGGKQTLGRMGV